MDLVADLNVGVYGSDAVVLVLDVSRLIHRSTLSRTLGRLLHDWSGVEVLFDAVFSTRWQHRYRLLSLLDRHPLTVQQAAAHHSAQRLEERARAAAVQQAQAEQAAAYHSG